MKEITENDLWRFITSYHDCFHELKPFMFWFHSNADIDIVKAKMNENPEFSSMLGHPLKQGNKYAVWDGKTVRLSEHPEILGQFVYPPTMTEKTKIFVYHRYLMQLDKESLQYCLDMSMKFPVVCLMNNYSLKDDRPCEELLSFIENNFEQYQILPII